MRNEPLKLKKRMVLFVVAALGIIAFSGPVLWAQLDVDASIDGVAFSNASAAELDQAPVLEAGIDTSQMGNALIAAAQVSQEAALLCAGTAPAGEGEAGVPNGDFNSQAGFIAMELAVNLALETFGGNIPPEMQAQFNAMERNFSTLAEMDRSMDPTAMAQMFTLAFSENIHDPGTFATMLESMANAPHAVDPLGGSFQPGTSVLGDIGGPIGADFAASLMASGDTIFDPSVVAATISEGINNFINQTVFEQQHQILATLPPEALALLGALNADFTGADLATLVGGTPSISRAFSAEIAGSYEGQNYAGLEHIHVTYTRDADGDGLYPVDHADANVTAIHNESHTHSVVLDTEGADHIPGIQA